MKPIHKNFIPFCVFTLFFACSQDQGKALIGMVGEEEITINEYRLLANFETTDEIKMQLIESLVEEKLLLHQAKQDGIKVSEDEFESFLKTYADPSRSTHQRLQDAKIDIELWEKKQKEKLILSKWFSTQIDKQNGLSLQNKRNYYNKHLREFFKPRQVRAKQIMVSSEEKAKRLHAQLVKGENFSTLARQYSESPDAEWGGDLGFIKKGTHPTVFEETAFSLEVGEISGVVRSGYGYHIFKVIEKRKAHVPPYDTIEAVIEKRLYEERVDSLRASKLKTLKAKIPIALYEETIKSIR